MATITKSLLIKHETTSQKLASIIKSARDTMRKDKGLNGNLDKLPMLTWIMFLKFLDDQEQINEDECELRDTQFFPLIEYPYRWRDWANNSNMITGDELIAFIVQSETVLPNGTKGSGLFTYLRNLISKNGDPRSDVVATVFRGVTNRMENGYLLREVINKVNEIHFNASEEIYTLSHMYELMLKEMRDTAGDSGEFYTPRPVIQFMVKVIDPKLGETVLDPACGTGGFLAESYEYLKLQTKTVSDRDILQDSIYGCEAKSLPYLLAQMNLTLHGIDSPNIDYGNALRIPIIDINDAQRVDVILTNPPFGGEEEKGILSNFPDNLQTSETTLLFLQLIMRRLKRSKTSRAAVIVPNTTLFVSGIAAKIREKLLTEYNLHTIIRLPKGVFEPYTDIETNILFFDRSMPTNDILYYRLNPPNERKQYTKTQPLKSSELSECYQVIVSRSISSPNAWRVNANDILNDSNFNLDIHNPKQVYTTAEDPVDVINKFTLSFQDIIHRINSLSKNIELIKEMINNKSEWRKFRLGDVLTRVKDSINIEDETSYKRITIQVKGRGVILRDEVMGLAIGTKKQYRVKEGQFVLSKIDARNGAFGIIPEECDDAIITSNFWSYDVDAEKISPKILSYLTVSDIFVQFCIVSSPGATNRRYLQEDKFLDQYIYVPPSLSDQDLLCDCLDLINHTSQRQETDLFRLHKRSSAIIQSTLHLVFGGTEQAMDEEDPVLIADE